MPVWHLRFQLKDLLSDEDDPDTVRRVARETHERMTAYREKLAGLPGQLRQPHDYDKWDEIADEFHSVAFADGSGDVDEYNGVLGELYDFADDHRIWID